MNFLIDKSQILILVSHDINLVKRLCNRIVMVDSGIIIDDGPVKNLVLKYAL